MRLGKSLGGSIVTMFSKYVAAFFKIRFIILLGGSPLFKKLSILKMNDLIEYYVAIFMFKYNNNLLPLVFKNVFVSVSTIHKYQTRSATKENFYIPKAKTNYGKFNIRFQGAKTWNAIEESLRKVGSLKKFRYNLKSTVIKY